MRSKKKPELIYVHHESCSKESKPDDKPFHEVIDYIIDRMIERGVLKKIDEKVSPSDTITDD